MSVRSSSNSIKSSSVKGSTPSAKKDSEYQVKKEPRKCSRCPNYYRKLQEIQQNLSGREQIIEVITSQHNHLQEKYKHLLNETESLRLERNQLVQDSLYFTERENLKLCCKCRNQDQAIQIQSSIIKPKRHSLSNRDSQELQAVLYPLCSSVSDTAEPRRTASYQKGDLLKDVINKLLVELKNCKCLNNRDMQKIAEFLNRDNRSNRHEPRPSNETPTKEITYCQDNSKSSPCLCQNREKSLVKPVSAPCVPACPAACNTSNHQSHNRGQQFKASSHSRSSQDVSIKKLHETKSAQCTAPCAVSRGVSNSNLNQGEVNELVNELIKTEIAFSECKCRFSQQVLDLTENNALLSDTLGIVTAENKSNTQKVEDLRKELRELSDEYDKYVCDAKCTIAKLEHELEDYKSNEEILKQSNENEKTYFQGQIKKLQRENEDQQTEIEEYKRCDEIQCNKLFAANEKVLDLTKTVQGLEAENKNLRDEVAGLKDEIIRLKCLCKKAETKASKNADEIDDLNNTMDKQQNKINDLQKQLEDTKRENAELRNQLDECRSKLKELLDTCKCEELNNELQKVKAEIAKKQAIIGELEKTISSFNTVMAQCEQNLEELSQENDSLQNENSKLKNDIEVMKAEFTKKSQDLLDENDELRQHLKQCRKEGQELIDKYKGMAADLVNGNNQLSAELDNARQKSKELQDKLNELQKEHNDSTSALTDDNKALKEALRQSEQSLRDLENLEHDLHAAQDREISYVNQINDLKASVAKYKDECAKKCAETLNLQSCLDESERNKTRAEDDLRSLRKNYTEFKSNCSAKCAENDHLKQKLDQANCQCTSLFDTVERLERVLADLQNSYDQKCAELDTIKSKYGNTLYDCKNLMNTKSELEKELDELKKKNQELADRYEQRMTELTKLKKQCESCSKLSQITREEYCNLKKEYKDIKNMLTDQIHKYKYNMDEMQNTQGGGCKILASLKQKLLEKEQQIAALQQNAQKASYEIIELKDYIHKLISDNNILKSAINGLINNLESKLKGSNVGTSTACLSTEDIANQILQTLTYMEYDVAQKSQNYRYKECNGPKEFEIEHSAPKTQKPKCLGCKKMVKELKESSTDSDDREFFDRRSIDALKEALNDLKESNKPTENGKACICDEQLFRSVSEASKKTCGRASGSQIKSFEIPKIDDSPMRDSKIPCYTKPKNTCYEVSKKDSPKSVGPRSSVTSNKVETEKERMPLESSGKSLLLPKTQSDTPKKLVEPKECSCSQTSIPSKKPPETPRKSLERPKE